MRRYSFFLSAFTALATFVALSAFTGHAPWNRNFRWRNGWHREWRHEHRDCDSSDRDQWHRAPFFPGNGENRPFPGDSPRQKTFTDSTPSQLSPVN